MNDRNIKNIEKGVYFGWYDSIYFNTLYFQIPNIGMLTSKNTDTWTKIKLINLLEAFKINCVNMSISNLEKEAKKIKGIPIKIICRQDYHGAKVDIHEFELLEKEIERIVEVDSFYEN